MITYPELEIKNLFKNFNGHEVIKDLSLKLNEGELACLIGPSGCGKTTLLRAIAGFEELSGGKIIMQGNPVSTAGFTLAPEKRRVGMLFQDYALFPHLTVQANTAFGLKGLKKSDRKKQVLDMLRVVGIEDAANKYPMELSGGQQQRLALARALILRPRLLLLDEPFSNLDVNLREKLSMEVRNIIKKHNTTALMVTHNQNEAFAIADKIGVISDGRLLQWDSAYNVYHKPAQKDVASFVGEGALLKGRALNNDSVECSLGTFTGNTPHDMPDGSEIEILIRPEDIVLSENSPLKATIIDKTFRGPNHLYKLKLDCGSDVLALLPSHVDGRIGQIIGIKPDMKDTVFFSNEGQIETQ